MSSQHSLLTITVSKHPGKAIFSGLFLTFRLETRFYAISLTCLSMSLSFALRDLISGYTTHEHGPAPSPASGFRPSGLSTPVSTGVPTCARNLGGRGFSFAFFFVINLCYRLLVFSVFCAPNLCYRSTLLRIHPSPCTIIPRTLVFLLCTSNRFPRILRVAAQQGTTEEGG